MSWDLFGPPDKPQRPSPQRGRINNERLAQAVARSQFEQRRPEPRGNAEEWTVSAVNAAMREMVEAVFPPMWVKGEITNFTRARSGHCYFTLRDDRSQLKCVMWRDEAIRLPTAPEEGMEVRVLGRLALYEQRGEYQLTVSELEGRGEGLWKLAMERLRVKLEAEGLTSADRKRPLPIAPASIGVVTSLAGAVLHDIVTVVRRRAPATRIVVCGCRVQGEGAAAEIAGAIGLMNRANAVDVIIVGRGGGSLEDLWAFNEEVVARAIANSRIPIVSAVGHETDITIADLVADLRAPTPSAAAEAAVPDARATARDVARLGSRMSGAVAARLAARRRELKGHQQQLSSCIDDYLGSQRQRLARVARHLGALSPLRAFERGFAIPVSAEGSVLRTGEQFPAGTEFDLRVQDGVVPCRVERRESFGPPRDHS